MCESDIELIHNVMASHDLSERESHRLFTQIVTGRLDEICLSALLTGLKMKGETADEIAGAARALAENALPFPSLDFETADNCGTGGDGTNTINISTTCAILAAVCGVKVAKHGNRKVSSQSGSADVLSELGIKLDMSAEHAKACLEKTNLTFLMAPVYHAGIKYAMPVRQTLKVRTIFNILGPLVNPAQSGIKVVGVYSEDLCRPVAESLKLLGKSAAWVVHGSGMDELALHGPSKVAQLKDGEITEFKVSPEDFGLERFPLSELLGGTPKENAANIRRILDGKGNEAHNTAVILNTAPILYLYGLASSVTEAVSIARDVLMSGRGLSLLNEFVAMTHKEEASQ